MVMERSLAVLPKWPQDEATAIKDAMARIKSPRDHLYKVDQFLLPEDSEILAQTVHSAAAAKAAHKSSGRANVKWPGNHDLLWQQRGKASAGLAGLGVATVSKQRGCVHRSCAVQLVGALEPLVEVGGVENHTLACHCCPGAGPEQEPLDS